MGGIATLLVAVLYSFPLGVWDRFIESPDAKRKMELQSVRSALDQSAILFGEYARIVGTINPQFAGDIAQRSLNTRVYLLMTRNEAIIDERRAELSTAELIVVAFNFQTMARVDRAIEYAKLAVDKAQGDAVLLAEARRHLAMFLLAPSPHRNVTEARITLRTAVDALMSNHGPQSVAARITLLGQWARFELTDPQGDSRCGNALRLLALEEASTHARALNDGGTTEALLQSLLSGVPVGESTQEAGRC